MELLSTGTLGILLVLVIVLWWSRARARARANESGPGRGRANPRARDSLDTVMHWEPQPTRVLTPAERKVFVSLRLNLPEHIVLAQVPLARFLKVPTRHSYSEWLRRVGLMCADLVVCDGNSQVIAVVDIRPPEAQENERAKQRYERMERVIRGANLPLFIWREDALPNAALARNTVLGLPPDTPLEAIVTAAAPERSKSLPLDPPSDDDMVESPAEARAATWYDDLDSAPAPLGAPSPPPAPPRR